MLLAEARGHRVLPSVRTLNDLRRRSIYSLDTESLDEAVMAALEAYASPLTKSLELILHFGCLVPLAWVLGVTFKLGLTGLWSAAIVYIVALAFAMAWKFWAGGWRTIKL